MNIERNPLKNNPFEGTAAPRRNMAFGDLVAKAPLPTEKADGAATTTASARQASPATADNAALHPGILAMQALDADGWHNIMRFDPSEERRYPLGKTFAPRSWDAIADYIKVWNGVENLYFSVNEPRPNAPDGKLAKTDIANIRAVFSDVDPKDGFALSAERDRLHKLADDLSAGPVPPSIVIDSGSGVQMVWKLEAKLPFSGDVDNDPSLKAAEELGRGVGHALGGDPTQNIDRILRMPGTINIPNALKLRKGRVKAQAKLLRVTDKLYTLDAMAQHYEPRAEPKKAENREGEVAAAQSELHLASAFQAVRYDDLNPELREKFEDARRANPKLDLLWEAGEHDGSDHTGSGRRFALASRLRRDGRFDVNDFASLLWIWDHAVQPGDDPEAKLTEREITRCWGNTKPTSARSAVDPEQVFEASAADPDGDDAASDWPEPLDIFGDEDPMDLGNLPDNALPPIIDRFARSEARRKGVSLAFAASAAIGVTAAAIGASLRIQVKKWDTGWTEPASLWLALVANPGRVKTPTISAATKPLQDIDGEFFKAWKAQHDLWTERTQANKKRKDGPSAGAEPIMRRTAVDDVTLEKQVRIHADNPRGILRAPDELMSFFESFGAYKANGGGDRTQMLRMFDGGTIVHDRVAPGTIRAEQALMGIVAGTQPEKIAKAVKDLGADGMLQRFLFVLDDGKARKGVDEAPDTRAASDYQALLRVLIMADYGSPSAVRMDEAAQELFQEMAESINELKGLVGMPLAWPGHIEKWGKFFPRLVLTFHCIDMFASYGLTDPTLQISKATVERAGNFARFLLRHSMTFYRQYFDLGQDVEESRWFAGYLLTHPEVDSVTPRTIYTARKSLQGEAHKKLVVRIMKDLENAGWLRTAEQGADGPARCSVNPMIHARFTARAEWERRDREAKRAAIEKSAQAKRWLTDETSGK